MWTNLKLYIQALTAGMAKEQEGQTLVEYALIIALVSIALIVALQALTGALNGVFNTITTTLGNA